MPLPEKNSDHYMKLLAMGLDRIRLSQRAMTQKHKDWRRMDDSYKAYINLPQKSKDRRSKAGTGSDYPGTEPIIIPKSFAQTITLTSHLHSVFTRRQPVFQIEAQSPDSYNSAKFMEMMLQHQWTRTRGSLQLYFAIQAMLKYRMGAATVLWLEHVRQRTMLRDEPVMVDDGFGNMIPSPDGTTEPKRVNEYVTTFEGNSIAAQDPYNLHLDPRVPISELQRGEFVGWRYTTHINQLMHRQRDGEFENVDYIREATKQARDGKLFNRDFRAGGMTTISDRSLRSKQDKSRFNADQPTIDELVIELVPRSFGIGESNDLRKYILVIANESTLLRADEMELEHGEYPLHAAEFDPDGFSFLEGKSYLEYMDPLQQHVSWLINSHMENVRKSLNDIWVYDPTKIASADINTATPGARIRLLPAAEGQDVRTALQQLPVVDVTQGHMLQAEQFMGMMERIGFNPPNISGNVNSGRRSAREIVAAGQGGSSILQTIAETFSLQFMQPLVEQMIQNTQQLAKTEQWVRLVGETNTQRFMQDAQNGLIGVDPDKLLGEIYFVPNDGTAPLDQVYLAQVWQQILQTVGSSEMLSQRFNVMEIFKETVGQLGVRNFERFEIMDDAQLQAMVQQGNAVPQEQPGGSGETNASLGTRTSMA